MWNRNSGSGKGLIWASGTVTATGAGTTNLVITLPNGAIGRPLKLKASGGVAGNVTMQIANSQQIVVLVNPNAAPVEEDIPARAFPGPQGSVTVAVYASAAGVIQVAIGFAA
jgi:hypothetical protein